MPKQKSPWTQPMPEEQFAFLRSILDAPSPINLEGAMTYGVLKPFFEGLVQPGWLVHQFKGNAGIVLDTHPGDTDRCSVMFIGHADKIRLQVRSISDDGKIWINSDSFIPVTLIGHEVSLFSEDPRNPGRYRMIDGGTVEALGAIHFASPEIQKGVKGITPEMLYLELQMYGEDRRRQVEDLGIRPGDSIILKRSIRRGFSPDTFYGAYLDNGLGCFVVAELARMVSEAGGLGNIRIQFAIATHEEIGRFGSRVLTGVLNPDLVVAIDVDHDFASAPGVGDKRFTPLAMGKGYTLSTGSVTSEYLNSLIEQASVERGIPVQKSPSGRDTGTDAMAAVLSARDAASTSVGFPIRNMHTISEIGHTGDLLACVHGLYAALEKMNGMNRGTGITRDDLRDGHPRLDEAAPLTYSAKRKEKGKK